MMGIDAAMDENITYIYIHISHMYIYMHISQWHNSDDDSPKNSDDDDDDDENKIPMT